MGVGVVAMSSIIVLRTGVTGRAELYMEAAHLGDTQKKAEGTWGIPEQSFGLPAVTGMGVWDWLCVC